MVVVSSSSCLLEDLATDNLVIDFKEKAGKARLNAIEVTKVE